VKKEERKRKGDAALSPRDPKSPRDLKSPRDPKSPRSALSPRGKKSKTKNDSDDSDDSPTLFFADDTDADSAGSSGEDSSIFDDPKSPVTLPGKPLDVLSPMEESPNPMTPLVLPEVNDEFFKSPESPTKFSSSDFAKLHEEKHKLEQEVGVVYRRNLSRYDAHLVGFS